MKQKIKTLPKHGMERSSLYILTLVMIISLVLSACAPSVSAGNLENMITPLAPTSAPAPTSGRPEYGPGELVDYIAQSGDTLPALAARFNTTVDEIMEAIPVIPLIRFTGPRRFSSAVR